MVSEGQRGVGSRSPQVFHPEIMGVSPYHIVPLRLEPGLRNDQLAFSLVPPFDSSRMKNWSAFGSAFSPPASLGWEALEVGRLDGNHHRADYEAERMMNVKQDCNM